MHAQTILLLCLQEICNKLLSQGVCRAEVRVKAAQGKAKSMTAATKEDLCAKTAATKMGR